MEQVKETQSIIVFTFMPVVFVFPPYSTVEFQTLQHSQEVRFDSIRLFPPEYLSPQEIRKIILQKYLKAELERKVKRTNS